MENSQYNAMLLSNKNQNLFKNAKNLAKLEKIGIKGRINNTIVITLDLFEPLKQNLGNISFRFIAYLIKGFFMNLKKDYENFFKYLENFLEFYLTGVKPGKEKQTRKKTKRKETQKLSSLGNLSIFSEFSSEFEKMFKNSLDEAKIEDTLKRFMKFYVKTLDKKFQAIDFSKMTNDQIKEYFQKYVLEPLSQALPYDEICNYFEDNFINDETNSFMDIINYGALDNIKENKKSVRKTKTKGEMEIEPDPFVINELDKNMFNNHETSNLFNIENLQNDIFLQNNETLINLDHHFNFQNKFMEFVEMDRDYFASLMENVNLKNPYLKLDNDINWKIEIPDYIFKKSLLNVNTQSQASSKITEEAYRQFENHYRKVLLNHHLKLLKVNLRIENSDISKNNQKKQNSKNKNPRRRRYGISYLEQISEVLIIDSYEKGEDIIKTLTKNTENRNLPIPHEDIRGNNIFNEGLNFKEIDIPNMNFENDNLKGNFLDYIDDVCNSVFGSVKKLSPQNAHILKEENSKSINENIQNILKKDILKTINFSELKFNEISKQIKLHLSQYNFSDIEVSSMAFYNSLIIAQNENLNLFQNKPFAKILRVNL